MSETIPVIDIADYAAGRAGSAGHHRAPGA